MTTEAFLVLLIAAISATSGTVYTTRDIEQKEAKIFGIFGERGLLAKNLHFLQIPVQCTIRARATSLTC